LLLCSGRTEEIDWPRSKNAWTGSTLKISIETKIRCLNGDCLLHCTLLAINCYEIDSTDGIGRILSRTQRSSQTLFAISSPSNYHNPGLVSQFEKSGTLRKNLESAVIPRVELTLRAAIHSYLASDLPTLLDYEKFVHIYTAIDACYAVYGANQWPSGKAGHPCRANRIPV